MFTEEIYSGIKDILDSSALKFIHEVQFTIRNDLFEVEKSFSLNIVDSQKKTLKRTTLLMMTILFQQERNTLLEIVYSKHLSRVHLNLTPFSCPMCSKNFQRTIRRCFISSIRIVRKSHQLVMSVQIFIKEENIFKGIEKRPID